MVVAVVVAAAVAAVGSVDLAQSLTSPGFDTHKEAYMIGSGRVVGLILIVIGILTCLIGSALAITSVQAAGEQGNTGGMVLGIAFSALPALLFVGVGGYLFTRGRAEAAQMAEVTKQKKILNIIMTRGKASISDIVLEIGTDAEQVKAWIYDLVGKGLFSGYVNWKDGILYSRQASQMREGGKCPNCGGQLELTGKGVISCPFCGSEIFLAQ